MIQLHLKKSYFKKRTKFIKFLIVLACYKQILVFWVFYKQICKWNRFRYGAFLDFLLK